MSEQEPQNIDPFELGIPKTINGLKNEIGVRLSKKGSGSWLGIFNNKACALELAIDIAFNEGFINKEKYRRLLVSYNELDKKRELIIQKSKLYKTPRIEVKNTLMQKYINVVNLYYGKTKEN